MPKYTVVKYDIAVQRQAYTHMQVHAVNVHLISQPVNSPHVCSDYNVL